MEVSDNDSKSLLTNLLEKLVQDNILVKVNTNPADESSFYINSPRGRAAAELALSGSLFQSENQPRATLDIIKPNIFRLYEENIGPINTAYRRFIA